MGFDSGKLMPLVLHIPPHSRRRRRERRVAAQMTGGGLARHPPREGGREGRRERPEASHPAVSLANLHAGGRRDAEFYCQNALPEWQLNGEREGGTVTKRRVTDWRAKICATQICAIYSGLFRNPAREDGAAASPPPPPRIN